MLGDSDRPDSFDIDVREPQAYSAADGGDVDAAGGMAMTRLPAAAAGDGDLVPARELLTKLFKVMPLFGVGKPCVQLSVRVAAGGMLPGWGMICSHWRHGSPLYNAVGAVYWPTTCLSWVFITLPLLYKCHMRGDGEGTLEALGRLSITSSGAKLLSRLDFFAGIAPPMMFPPAWLLALVIHAFEAVTLPFDDTANITILIVAAACGSVIFMMTFEVLAIHLACFVIVRDRVQQTTTKLKRLVSESLSGDEKDEDFDPTWEAWDARSTMKEVYSLQELSLRCERDLNTSLLAQSVIATFGIAAIFTFGGATDQFGNLAVNLGAQFVAVSLHGQAFSLLIAPMYITVAMTELYKAANDMYCAVPPARRAEVETLTTFLRDMNSMQGPGYKILGQVVRPGMVSKAMSAVFTVVAGAFLSSLQGEFVR